jgi:putative transposase
LTDAEVNEIIAISCSERFMNTTPYAIVPILAEEGVYIASESSFYRVLREADLLKHRKNSRQCRKSEKIELKATGINQIWSWDITYLKTEIKGKFYYLYFFIDIWSRAIMGWEIHENESGEKASAMMAKMCDKHNIKKDVLLLHSDNGAPMKCATMLATLEFLGVHPSYSRPSVSDDNAYSESLFKTLKYTAGYPRYFKTIEQAKEWVSKFVEWYNNEHRHSKIDYVTPNQRHAGEHIEILEKRQETYAKAKEKNPHRWSAETREWKETEEVYLKKGNFKKAS